MPRYGLALLAVLANASAFAPAGAPGVARPRDVGPLRGARATRWSRLMPVRASVAAPVPGRAEWRQGVYWEWRGMKVRYAVVNPQGKKAPLLLVHGNSLRPSARAQAVRLRRKSMRRCVYAYT